MVAGERNDNDGRTNTRSRGWCFTINNYTAEHEDALRALTAARYMVFGREVGEQGTEHLQGYIYFATLKSFRQMKDMLPAGAHIEAARGSAEQNKDYCSKDGDFEEFGEMPMSQADKGLAGAEYWTEQREIIMHGELEDIDDKLFIKSYGTIKAIRKDFMKEVDDMPSGTRHCWYYGGTDSGKSYRARQEMPDYYDKMLNKWWDGYQVGVHDDVLLDDFDRNHAYLGSHLKRWLDVYAFKAEVKNGCLNLRPKKIIITSNYHPDELWSEDPQLLSAIKRRMQIFRFERKYEEPEHLPDHQGNQVRAYKPGDNIPMFNRQPHPDF